MTARNMAAPAAAPGPILASAALTSAAVLVTTAGLSGPVAFVVTFGFIALAPGWVATYFLRLSVTGASRVALATAISLAVNAEIALLSLWLGAWHPELLLYVVAVAVYAGLALAAWRGAP